MNKKVQQTKDLNLPDIITGGGDFVPENRQIFYYNFNKSALDEYLNYFRFFATSDKKESLGAFQQLLVALNNKLLNQGVFPFECMLYATRIISKELEDDEMIVKMLSSTIPNYQETPYAEDAKKALKNAVTLWDWSEQLLVIFDYLGTNKCYEIIDYVFEDCHRRRLTALHQSVKLAFVKMLMSTQNEKYNDVLVKQILININPNEKSIISYVVENYEKCGFNKEILKKYLYNSGDGYRKITNQLLTKQEITLNHGSRNHQISIIVERLDKVKSEGDAKSEVDMLISNLKGRKIDPSALTNMYRQLTRRRKSGGNEYLGDALAQNITAICQFANRYHQMYRIIANHINLEKGLVFFENELKRNTAYIIEIYACLTILDPTNQSYRQKIVELTCKEHLSVIDKTAIDFIFNYRKQLYEGFLKKIIGYLDINDEDNLFITFNNLKELCDFREQYRHIEQPAQLELIEAIGRYLEKQAVGNIKIQSWCLKILDTFKQNRKLPLISSRILVDVASGTFYSPLEIRLMAEEIIKKNVETERPS